VRRAPRHTPRRRTGESSPDGAARQPLLEVYGDSTGDRLLSW
jgi:hypothetical protein